MDFETANCKSDKDSLLKLSLFILRVKIGWEKKFFQLIFRSGIILGSKKGLGFSIPIEVCHAPCGAEKIMMRWASFDKASLFKMKVFLIRCLRRAERTMTVKMKRQRFIKVSFASTALSIQKEKAPRRPNEPQEKSLTRAEESNKSDLTRIKISNWLWMKH